jgi:nitrogen fixation protein FixH
MNTEPKPLTGRKVLLIAVAAFGVIVAANLAMLFAATGTFPGLVVKNSYIASQGWDKKTDAQRALGWRAVTDYADGTLRVIMTGNTGDRVAGLSVVAVVGRPATTRNDVRLELTEGLDGYAAPLDLAPGQWRVMITGTNSDGENYEAAAVFYVRDPA